MKSPYAAVTWRLDPVINFFGERGSPNPGRVSVPLDLCQFDMKEPGSERLYWKRSTLAATYPELTILEIQCAKQSGPRGHEHVQIRGHVETPEGWTSRAALSAKYPTALCLAWGYVISLVVCRAARKNINNEVKEREVALTRSEEAVVVLQWSSQDELCVAQQDASLGPCLLPVRSARGVRGGSSAAKEPRVRSGTAVAVTGSLGPPSGFIGWTKEGASAADPGPGAEFSILDAET